MTVTCNRQIETNVIFMVPVCFKMGLCLKDGYKIAAILDRFCQIVKRSLIMKSILDWFIWIWCLVRCFGCKVSNVFIVSYLKQVFYFVQNAF